MKKREKNYIIIGSNGSGKSTLAKIIAGIIKGYSEEIESNSKINNNCSLETLYVSKDNQFFQDNIENNLTLYGQINYDKKYFKIR